jgi:acetyl esterase/lipase
MARRDVLALAGALSASPFKMTAQATRTGAGAPSTPSDDRARLYGLLGKLPDRNRPVAGTRRSEVLRDGYVLETWDLDLNGIETVPAYVARPRHVSGRRPAVVFNHSHGGGYTVGKTEFIEGRDYLQSEPYAKALTDRGWIALAIDHWIFGERSHTAELEMFKSMIWHGQVLWGMMIFDSLKAVDWLVTRDDVDPARIGTIGMSMGSSMAQWLGALDPRIAAVVDICCLVDYQALIAEKGLGRHGIYYYVPSLLEHFTAAQINALIAPRPHLAITGLQDRLGPAAGVDRIDAVLRDVYAAAGYPDHWQIRRYDAGHEETPEGRREALAFLEQHL